MKKIINLLSAILLISAALFMGGCKATSESSGETAIVYGKIQNEHPSFEYLFINGKTYYEDSSESCFADSECTKPVFVFFIGGAFPTKLIENADIYLYKGISIDGKTYCFADVVDPPVFADDFINLEKIDTVKGTAYCCTNSKSNMQYTFMDFEVSDKFLSDLNIKITDWESKSCISYNDDAFSTYSSINDKWENNTKDKKFDLSNTYSSGSYTVYDGNGGEYEAFGKMIISDGSTDYEVYLSELSEN